MPRKFSCSPSRQLSPRRARALGWLTALTLVVPATVLAQEPLPQTHTVRKGDTLWDLAQAYLKDPFLWPGIYRLNTDVVEDPHWIYPGEVLRIAPSDNVAAVPAADNVASAPTMETPPPPQPADTTPMLGGDDSTETLARGPQQPSLAETESDDRKPLFQATRARTVAEILKAYTDQPYRPLRPSEFYSSGFMTENQRLPYGKVLGPATPQQIKATNSLSNALPFTTIVIAAPRGATYEVGDTLLVLQLGREIDPFGNIVVPTGLAQVTAAVDDHYLASVIAIYGPIRNGHRILPVEGFTPGAGTRAVPIADGIRGSLIGGLGRQELKEPQMVVFIDKGRDEGVARGDLFEVRRRAERLSDGTLRVNELMATLQIVHVRDHTATAMVLNVISPDIPPGTAVTQVAKLPS
ncbi:MAG TPA: LysM peptidoglycan-binding domain-containing protein [Gemmatimonadales bacterium]|nr:LysM peptidoglycan-binding domain-containing protein [Gemmatimonadales bacterium]